MKKIIALALSLMMILGCVSALAETAEKETLTMLGAFSIRYNKLPEEYTMHVTDNTEMLYRALITSADPAKPTMELRMEFNDEWYGVNTLADATEEDIAAVEQDFYDVAEMDPGDITFENAETGLGTPVLVVRTVDGSIGAIYTIYQSHEIEVDIFPAEGATLADEDIQTVLSFLTDVEFVPAEK